MHLPPAQHPAFARDGYLFFPGLFSAEETATLTAAVPELYRRREVYNVREKGSDAVRTNFAAHRVERAGGKNGGIVSALGLPASALQTSDQAFAAASVTDTGTTTAPMGVSA